jgi:hypothetical protein
VVFYAASSVVPIADRTLSYGARVSEAEARAHPSSATVVIAQHVQRGQEREYLRPTATAQYVWSAAKSEARGLHDRAMRRNKIMAIRIRRLVPALLAASLLFFLALTPLHAQPKRVSDRPIHGLGSVHMDISCLPGASADFDRARPRP